MKYKISANVIKRLPRYVRKLDQLIADGIEKVSSRELSIQLGSTASQIRQDFNCFGGFGQQGYGYNVRQLRDNIVSVLGMEQQLTAIVIGAGNLGHALISNFHFEECGVRLAAAFDTDTKLIGTQIAGTNVLDSGEMQGYLKDNKVDVAVLTLPKRSAHDMAKKLADLGVRGIWNFTGVDVDAGLPDGVLVENVHFSDSLLNLGYYLREHDERQEQQ